MLKFYFCTFFKILFFSIDSSILGWNGINFNLKKATDKIKLHIFRYKKFKIENNTLSIEKYSSISTQTFDGVIFLDINLCNIILYVAFLG